MAGYYDTTWYTNSVGYAAVTARPQNTAVAAGVIRRQFTTPSVNNERCFVCVVAGTTANTTDATWNLGRGATTVDGTATWQECTGCSAVNGDLTNTYSWAQVKAFGNVPFAGVIIKRNSGASYQILTAAGFTMAASEPAFSDTAGVTTVEGGNTWTSLGPVGNFTGGMAPHARLANAAASNWGSGSLVSPTTLYVGDNHAETQSTVLNFTISGGLPTFPTKVLCHNHSGSYPPAGGDITTGASITVTGGVNFIIFIGGCTYIYGITFKGSAAMNFSSSGGGNMLYAYFDTCSLQNTASSGNTITVGNSTAITLNNCTVSFAHIGSAINFGTCGQIRWQNTGPILAGGSLVPTIFIGNGPVAPASVIFEGVDLSQLTGSIFSQQTAQNLSLLGSLLFKDCKLPTSWSVTTPPRNGYTVQFTRCDSGSAIYKSSRYTYEGTETTETSITRVGGATDPTGQVQSRKIVTTANIEWIRPFMAEPYAIWNSTTGSAITVTVCGICVKELPNNDDIWAEINYLGTASAPVSAITTTTKAYAWSSNAAGTSDSSTWNSPAVIYDGLVSSGVTVSGGGLTVSGATTNTGAASSIFQYTGKYYFEVTMTTVPNLNDCVGVITDTGTFSNFVGSGTNCCNCYKSNGNIYSNGAYSGKTLGTINNGDVIGIAIDLTNRRGWLRKNGGNWNGDATANPATNTNGVTLYSTVGFAPAVGIGSTSTSTFTSNFGTSAYANAAPSGFNNWSSTAAWFAFKLTKTITPQLPGYIDVRVKVAKISSTYFVDPKVVLAPAPTGTTTWNPSDKLSTTLSGGNLAAQGDGNIGQGVRATPATGSGKFYWEYTLNTTMNGNTQMGLASGSASLSYSGAPGAQTAMLWGNGSIYVNGTGSGSSVGPPTTGNVLGIALDTAAALIWFRLAPSGNWNGSGTANPATGTGGISISALTGSLYPAYGAGNFAVDKITANFGASAFTGTAPSGFGLLP